jgi:hypothetical protein
MSTRDPNGPTLCKQCLVRTAEDNGSGICFLCRVSSVGFSFVGGGRHGRASFHDSTNTERRAEILGDRVLGVDTEPASNFGG